MKLRSLTMKLSTVSFLALAAACSSAPGGEPTSGTEQASTLAPEFTGHIIKPPRPDQMNQSDLAEAKVGPFTNACGTAPHMNYLGGQVISSVNVIAVYWTANVDPNVKAHIPQFYTDVVTSSSFYGGVLGQYSTPAGPTGTGQTVTTGQFGGAHTITPGTTACTGATACTLSNVDIRKELVFQINHGHLPQPTKDAQGKVNSLYVFEFPANVTLTLTIGGSTSQSCVQFCGYHEQATLNGEVIPFGVIPDFLTGACNSACVTNSAHYFHDVTSVHTHELAEAVTDANVTINSTGTAYIKPSAWADQNCGEIGDICSYQETPLTFGADTWYVQQLWSNSANGGVGDCVAP